VDFFLFFSFVLFSFSFLEDVEKGWKNLFVFEDERPCLLLETL